jgi:hypothetical protein
MEKVVISDEQWTGCSFIVVPGHGNADGLPRRMQAVCAIKPPWSGAR